MGDGDAIPSQGDILDTKQKHANRFYGVAGMVPYSVLRGLCRQRLLSMDDSRVVHEMNKISVVLEEYVKIGDKITGVSSEYVDKLKRWQATARWGKQNPQVVSNIIRGSYKDKWVPQQGGHGPSADDNPTCPYEDNPNNNVCHGCHVARIVWDKLQKKAQTIA